MGLATEKILARSDLYGRKGKNQHASCWHIDKADDIRILANIERIFRWLSTMVHEMGHGVYDTNSTANLPWLLRGQSHIMTTEAMAIMAQAYLQIPATIKKLGLNASDRKLLAELSASWTREKLIFSRWANVMVRFEKGMYENPEQDLQKLWWDLVSKYQGIQPPAGREHDHDYAAKAHITGAPCYYQNYLIADIIVAQLENTLDKLTGGSTIVGSKKAGRWLVDNWFAPGATLRWDELIKKATGRPLDPSFWTKNLTI